MKPPAIDYAVPASLADAVHLLASHAGNAKLIAGGQSLIPMLNFRLLDSTLLIDITRLPGFDHITTSERGITVGAGVQHHALKRSPDLAERLPIIRHTMRYVAHMAIRNRGTIGGSLAHGDPAAELPLLAVLLDAYLHIIGPTGERSARAKDFFLAPLTTNLNEDEILTSVTFPNLPQHSSWGFEEITLRSGDFALAGAGAVLSIQHGVITDVRLAVMGVDETPRRLPTIEAMLLGRAWGAGLRRLAVRQVREQVNPMSDLQASADYRRHLAGIVAARTLDSAWAMGQAR